MSRPQSGVRPQSGRPQSGRPQSGPRSRPQSGSTKGMKYPRGDVVSYEDVLVAQYLEDLRKAPGYQNGASQNPSPYIQKLAHTHIVPTPHSVGARRQRPHSAFVSFRPQSGSNKPKMDPRFIADPDMYDPATPREQITRRKKRPFSAPAYRRPLSATYGSSRPTSAKSSAFSIYSSNTSTTTGSVLGRRTKSLYKKQPMTIVATAFKNGCRDVFTRVAAPSVKMLLEMCTDRLGLPHAARRVFLDDGTEIVRPEEIERDSDIYISMGENFKNPFKDVKQQTQQQRTLAWTVNGLAWSGDTQRKPTKNMLSKRFRQMLEPSKRRVLVFKNSHGTEGVEIVADPDRFEDFLVACTARLELGSYARILYDWEGQEIRDLKEAPVLDSCLQTWTTPVLGPLWVSKGEGFSPKGVNDFLTGLINYTRSKSDEAHHYRTQLNYAKREETRSEVSIVAILSMSEGELEETLKIVEKDVEDFGRALARLKQQMNKLKEMVAEEVDHGVSYKLKHVDEYGMDHRLVGAKGIRLKVFENGRYEDDVTIYFNLAQATKGIGHDQKKLLARLLDQCSDHHALSQPKTNTAIRPVAQKIFDKTGNEIDSVYDLEYDQEVWLSFGEPWKNPFTFVLTAQFDKIRGVDIQGQKQAALREQLMSEDLGGYEKAACWEVVSGMPETYNWMAVSPSSDPMDGAESQHIMNQLEAGEIDVKSDFLKCKDNPDLVLYAEPTVDTKKKKGSKAIWPSEAQQWLISKEGNNMMIHAKYNARLVLGVSPFKLTGTLGHPTLGPTETRVEGFLVTFQRKTGDLCQAWRFTDEGCIESQSDPTLRLTYLGSRFGDEDSHVLNENEGIPKGMKNYLAACQKIEGRDAKAQRWAMKQERMENLGQWKHTQADNAEWNKRALSWPVDKNGEINENYDWPMEGFLLPYAPPLKVKKEEKKDKHRIPRRLMVLKNGVRDVSKAISVVGPDLSNMRKDVHASKVEKKNKKNRPQPGDNPWEQTENSAVTDTGVIHCEEDLTVLKLEFILFLERATQLINLPFAARRIYDETGKEHFSLRSFTRDQLIYVSCGEPWTDPNLSKAEQQRRYLLANLGSDVAQIRQFIALRDPTNLVLEAESLTPGAKIIINNSAIVRQKESEPTEKEDEEKKEDEPEKDGTDKRRTAHEASHERAEERLNKMKWPWEREGAGSGTEDTPVKGPEAAAKRLRSRRPVSQTVQLQKFSYDEIEGYITCQADSSLVLGVEEVEGNVSEVVLMRRRVDDINQRWLLDKGLIIAKANTTRVLSVIMPSGVPVDEDGLPLTYVGSEVALQNRKMTQFGRANQKWEMDVSTGLIEAFVTDKWDKEVTAANKANVCTYAVMRDEKLDQPGYRVELSAKAGNKFMMVCSACARAMRGRHKLERIAGNVDFACDMGQGKNLGIKQIGSFQCLNGKVDLTTTEAAHTLKEWETQLEKLREELSVRAIANKISAARVPFTLKVLAYKNGEGRIKPAELIIGSSVPGILEQCTYRLGLTQAARRLYTADGFMVLRLEDLVSWVQENYVTQAKAQLRAQRRGRRADNKHNKTGDQSSLMDKVDLEESEEEEEEEEEQEEENEAKPEDAEDFAIGYEVLATRKQLDEVEGCMLVPNPMEELEQEGFVYLWNFYCMKPGKLFVHILRPDIKNLNSFHVIDQADFDIQQPGEYSVDMTTIENTPWFGKGMAVKKGDVIGFYCPGPLMLPYDVDESINQAPFFYQSATHPAKGDNIPMRTWQQPGTRKYSLNAFVRPANKTGASSNKSNVKVNDNKAVNEKGGKKKKKELKNKGPHVDLPPAELVMKYPIEVWVSCGETFKKPEKVERQLVQSMQERGKRAAVSYELDKEKHILRQMQGRRLDEMSPGQYKSTMNPTYPVLVEGHWQDLTQSEQQKHDTVHQLQTHLSDMKSSQKSKFKGYTGRLYTQSAMKRVLVFPNGESVARAVYIWGETIPQLLDNSTTRLNLRKAGRYLFNMSGTTVNDMEEVERDQLLCVSYTKSFQRPKDSQQNVEVKANWSRARKQYGNAATDIVVEQQTTPGIGVDPFGPSHLVNGSTAQVTAGAEEKQGEETPEETQEEKTDP